MIKAIDELKKSHSRMTTVLKYWKIMRGEWK